MPERNQPVESCHSCHKNTAQFNSHSTCTCASSSTFNRLWNSAIAFLHCETPYYPPLPSDRTCPASLRHEYPNYGPPHEPFWILALLISKCSSYGQTTVLCNHLCWIAGRPLLSATANHMVSEIRWQKQQLALKLPNSCAVLTSQVLTPMLTTHCSFNFCSF